MLNVLRAHDAAQEDVFGGVGHAGRDAAGAVDQVDALHQGDVLPDLGLAGDGGDRADLFLAEGVDNGGLAGVGVADEADRDLLAGRVEGGELAEEGDEGSLAEGVGDGGVEGEGGVFAGKEFDPTSLRQCQYTVDAVIAACMQDENAMTKEKDVCPKTKQSFTLALAQSA